MTSQSILIASTLRWITASFLTQTTAATATQLLPLNSIPHQGQGKRLITAALINLVHPAFPLA